MSRKGTTKILKNESRGARHHVGVFILIQFMSLSTCSTNAINISLP